MTPATRGEENSKRVFKAVIDHWLEDRCPPTVADIEARTGLTKTPIDYHLKKLEASGKIRRRPGRSRGIEPVGLHISIKADKSDLPQ